MAAKKKATRKTYSDEEKAEVLAFVKEYDEKHGRGGNKAASEKFAINAVTISQWNKKASGGASAPEAPPAGESVISEEALIKVLAAKGFKFTRLVNALTGEVVEEKTDPKIDKLNLVYRAIPTSRADSVAVYVTQTSPQIQVAMTLDKLLELAGIRP